MTAKIRGLVVGSVLFAVYAATAGRGVGWEDSAFFQLALATLGVPHGPGFPIYVLTGHVWLLAFPGMAAWGANLFSAAVMAVAGVVLLEIILELYGTIQSTPRTMSKAEIFGAIGVVLAWATLPDVWSQAVRTEVYPLALLYVLLSIWLMLLGDRHFAEQPQKSHRLKLGAFWVWGMGMAIHPLVVFAATLPWLVSALWRWRRNRQAILLAVGCALVPFSAYFYPLVRGRIAGVWTWGSFHDWASILDYYLRRSAWAAVPAGQNSYLENMQGWAHTLASEWPVFIWIPFAIALIWLRRRRNLAVGLACVAALVVWAAPFDRVNLDLWGYFLPFIAFMAAAIGVFVVRSIGWVNGQLPALSERSRQMLGIFAALVLIGWPALTIMGSSRAPNSQAGAADLVADLTSELARGATLVAAEDNVLGVLEYTQRVEGIRTDIKLIAPGALRYPFYRQQIVKRFGPDVPASWSEPGVWDARKWASEVDLWISSLDQESQTYTQFDALPGLRADRLIPVGVVYRIVDSTVDVDLQDAWDFWQHDALSAVHDPVAADIYGRWLFNFGAFALARQQDEIGWKALVAAVDRANENPEMFYLLGGALQRAGRVQQAATMFAAAYELAPYRSRYREALEHTERPLAERP